MSIKKVLNYKIRNLLAKKMTHLYYSSTWSFEKLDGTDLGSIDIEIDSNSDIPGTFRFDIDSNDLKDKDMLTDIFGSNLSTNERGVCTWTDLPSDAKKVFDKQITAEERLRYNLVAQTLIADGDLIITKNKL